MASTLALHPPENEFVKPTGEDDSAACINQALTSLDGFIWHQAQPRGFNVHLLCAGHYSRPRGHSKKEMWPLSSRSSLYRERIKLIVKMCDVKMLVKSSIG